MGDLSWTEEHVRRVFWRGGFGATPQEARELAAAGRDATLRLLLDGAAGPGEPELAGPEPTVDDGRPIDPVNEWAHDVLWWLDRMVRTRRPLVEKLTLFWHDHFATADQDTPLMLAQNRLLRRHALGSFPRLVDGVMRDPAMQLFLSLADSSKDAPNENFARELVELFTLGGEGYTERDVREIARALTGWRADWGDDGLRGIRWDPSAHDRGRKVIFGRRGRFGPREVVRLVTEHPRHAPFLVGKLWSFFVTEPLDAPTRAALVKAYVGSRRQIRPVVERILAHPALYASLDAPQMVKAPIVHVAGVLRTTGTPITTDAYGWLLDQMGQFPFHPPSVAGWDWGAAWLSTNAMRARVTFANMLLAWGDAPLAMPDGTADVAWTPEQHLDAALEAMGRPWISAGTRTVLLETAAGYQDNPARPRRDRADMLQRLLRHLLISGPDAQLH
ncbi:MAG TPA: DUF1800 domain-containing protein [Capillimicrobium sp.]|nr:DUF1800 domain-containing protein [Capillimicrobium sp.]